MGELIMKKELFCILAASFALTGCLKDTLSGGVNNVSFKASNSYDNGPVTKTEYSNEFYTYGTTRYERINWLASDKIRIWSPQATSRKYPGRHYADYQVQPARNESEKSYATIQAIFENDESTGLQWADDNNHTFYALYPSPVSDGVDATKVSISDNVITATLSSDQTVNTSIVTNGNRTYTPDMRYAYMWAARSATRGAVELEFRPLMTAFEFSLGPEDAAGMTLQKFTMRSSAADPAITGDYMATINNTLTGYSLSGTSASQDKIEFTFPDIRVEQGKYVTFTIFALPKTIEDVTISVQTTTGVRTLELKQNGSFVPFPGGKKYRITNLEVPPGETWTYEIDDIADVITYGHNPVSGLSFQVNSYKYSNVNPTHVPAAWTATVTSVTNAVAGDLDASAWSGDGADNQKAVSIINPASNQYPDDPGADASVAAAAKLASNPYRGSDSAPWDLSTHKFYGTETDLTATVAQETANCYVVSSPGVYKFPLVYGNAIAGGGTNTTAYAPGGDPANRLTTFQNYSGASISSPYILTDISAAISSMEAAVVWQDVPQERIILRSGNYGVGGTGASDAYIWFKVESEDIKQGNIILALRDKSSKTICWSWHIWITEKISESDFVLPVENPFTTNLKMLKYNLGWTDASNATGFAYPTRVWTIRVTLNEDPSVAKTFVIRQVGYAKQVPANIGTNTFYQWGRKDPELPARNSLENKQFYSNDGYSPDGGQNEEHEYILNNSGPTSMVIANTIRNPHIHYYANTNNPRWTTLINLWDADEVAYDADGFIDKTVYDPCPPGFNVPRRSAFVVFTNKSGSWELNNTGRQANGDATVGLGVNYFTRRNRQGQRIFFPATGARREKSNFQAIFELGYYWSAAQVNGGSKARSLQLYAIDGYAGFTYAIYDQWNSAGYTIRSTTEN